MNLDSSPNGVETGVMILRHRSANPALIGWSILMLAALAGVTYELCADMLHTVPIPDTMSQRIHPERISEAPVRHAPPSPPRPPWRHTIPYVLWQTYKTKALPKPAVAAMSTWSDLNPGLTARLYSDPEASDFINRTLGPEVRCGAVMK